MSHDQELKFFSSYFTSSNLLVEGFDWSVSDSLDLGSVSFSGQNKQYLRFLKAFRDAKVFSGGSAEQLAHLFQLLQISIKQFCLDHQKQSDKINDMANEINSLKQKIDELSQNYKNDSENYFCPICMVKFSTMKNVDTHIKVSHPTLFQKWKEFRLYSKSPPFELSTLEMPPGSKIINQSDVLNYAGRKLQEKIEEHEAECEKIKQSLSDRLQEYSEIGAQEEMPRYVQVYHLNRDVKKPPSKTHSKPSSRLSSKSKSGKNSGNHKESRTTASNPPKQSRSSSSNRNQSSSRKKSSSIPAYSPLSYNYSTQTYDYTGTDYDYSGSYDYYTYSDYYYSSERNHHS